MRRFGFTLIEVNLAMFIMAVGTLGLVGLYAYGYREGQQSNEDVQAAAVAECTLNAMIAALSSTNVSWTAWQGLGTQPANGWGQYAGDGTGTGVSADDGSATVSPLNKGACNSTAKTVFDKVMSAAGFSAEFDSQNLAVGIVLSPSSDGRTYKVSVRAARRASTLVYQPLYYAEVYYQGMKKN